MLPACVTLSWDRGFAGGGTGFRLHAGARAQGGGPWAVAVAMASRGGGRVVVAAFSLQPGWIVTVWTLLRCPWAVLALAYRSVLSL